jgi:hypothetical protein
VQPLDVGLVDGGELRITLRGVVVVVGEPVLRLGIDETLLGDGGGVTRRGRGEKGEAE